MAYSSDRNSIRLKMTKWKRILEIIPFSLLGFFVFCFFFPHKGQ